MSFEWWCLLLVACALVVAFFGIGYDSVWLVAILSDEVMCGFCPVFTFDWSGGWHTNLESIEKCGSQRKKAGWVTRNPDFDAAGIYLLLLGFLVSSPRLRSARGVRLCEIFWFGGGGIPNHLGGLYFHVCCAKLSKTRGSLMMLRKSCFFCTIAFLQALTDHSPSSSETPEPRDNTDKWQRRCLLDQCEGTCLRGLPQPQAKNPGGISAFDWTVTCVLARKERNNS